jgi:hypothetical protein
MQNKRYSLAVVVVLLSAAAGLDSFDSLLDSLVDSLLGSLFGALFRTPEGDLWSVAYQPEPLNTIPTGAITLRRLFLLHSGQMVRGWSLKL